MEACAEEYYKLTGVRVRLTAGTTELGIEAAASGAADLGGASRPMFEAREAAYPGLKSVVVAWDAIAVVVHPDNPVSNISREDLIRVFQGRTKNWMELGGAAAPVLVIDRHGEWNAARLSFRQLICDDPRSYLAPAPVRLHNCAHVELLVERQRNAIALTGISSARKRRLKILSVDKVAPTPTAISEGTYPYYRPLYLVYRPNHNRAADRFVQWILSPEGQQVIEREGTVSNLHAAHLVRNYKYFPGGSQICNLESLRRQTKQAFASEASP